jgi:hypothetical protein
MSNEIFVKMALDAWQGQLKSTDSLLNKLSDEQLMQEVSPGRNRGIYLLGHLVAVHDMMLPLLLLGESQYPEFYPIFVQSPDRAVADLPSIVELRAQWTATNEKLSVHFASLTAGEWLRFCKRAAPQPVERVVKPHQSFKLSPGAIGVVDGERLNSIRRQSSKKPC